MRAKQAIAPQNAPHPPASASPVGGDAEITTIFTVCSQGRRCEEEWTEARTRTDWVRLFLFTIETFVLVSNEMLRFGFAYLDKFVAFGLLNR